MPVVGEHGACIADLGDDPFAPDTSDAVGEHERLALVCDLAQLLDLSESAAKLRVDDAFQLDFRGIGADELQGRIAPEPLLLGPAPRL